MRFSHETDKLRTLGRNLTHENKVMAERVGFEPTVRFPARSLSRRVLSTAQPPLRGRFLINRNRAPRSPAITAHRHCVSESFIGARHAGPYLGWIPAK